MDQNTFGASEAIERILKWMVINLIRVVERKKDAMFKICSGSIAPVEPKMIWVKMMKGMRGRNTVLSVHTRFNKILEEILSNHKLHYIIDMDSKINDPAYSSNINELNGDGCIAYWLEIVD